MKRREVLSVLAGAAIWPAAASAQQTSVPVIGFLHQGSQDQNLDRLAAFHKGLGQAGFVEGQNIAIEYRWAGGQFDKLPLMAAELAARRVTVIVTLFSTDATLAARAATTSIPIVFVSSADTVQMGIVASLNRPGGNVTGVTTLNNELAPKRLALLRELAPYARRYYALINPTSDLALAFTRDVERAAAVFGVEIELLRASNDDELEAAFARVPQPSQGVLISGTDAFFFVRREQIATLAIRRGLPAIFDARAYTKAGGLVSYAGDDADLTQQATNYVGRILKGERPADLPVAQPTKFSLSINLKTANALGLTVPPSLLATADEVIE